MTDQHPDRDESVTDRPFAALRYSGAGLVRPDDRFAASLRRRVERALNDADTGSDASTDEPDHPAVELPPRKDQPMTTTTDSIAAGGGGADDQAPGRQIITPYIAVDDGPGALDWYVAALGATESVRYAGDDGRLGHAEFVINGATIMLSDAYPEIGVVAANSHEGSSFALHIEVPDCDALYARAVELGATSQREPAQQPHGARIATIVDPYGHRWMLSQPVTSPSTEEIDAGYDDFTIVEPD